MNTKSNLRAWCARVGVLLVSFVAVAGVHADDVRLAEVVKELVGTEAANEPVAKAPPLGGAATVSRRQIRNALQRAGLDPNTFLLPHKVRIERKQRNLSKVQIEQLVLQPLRERLSPCELDGLSAYSSVRVPTGALRVHLPRRPTLRSGRMSLIVQVEGQGNLTHIPVSALLTCPPPAVQAGDRVRLAVVVGAVRATAPGKAFQTGHVGEVVQVENSATRTRLSGRVVGPQQIEVLP